MEEQLFKISEAKKILLEEYGIGRSTRSIWTFIKKAELGRRKNPKLPASDWLVTAEEIKKAAHYFLTNEWPDGVVRRGGRR